MTKACEHCWIKGIPEGMVVMDTGGARVCGRCGLVEDSDGWFLPGIKDTLTITSTVMVEEEAEKGASPGVATLRGYLRTVTGYYE